MTLIAIDPPYSYDLIADYYDADMGESADPASERWYRARCAPGERVLEIGCGTGRLTLPLARDGIRVVALDSSLRMLGRLRAKLQEGPVAAVGRRISLVAMDMRRTRLAASFDAILLPYSVITYLKDPDEVDHTLSQLCGHLRDGGRLLLDCFVPDPQVEAHLDGPPLFDFDRPLADCRRLQRSKQLISGPEPGQREIRRFYRVLDVRRRELLRFETHERIRLYRPHELEAAIAAAGLVIEETSGAFGRAEYGPDAATVALACRANR